MEKQKMKARELKRKRERIEKRWRGLGGTEGGGWEAMKNEAHWEIRRED